MDQILLNGVSLNDIRNLVSEVIEEKLKGVPQKEISNASNSYLGRLEVAKLLRISLPTLNEWSKQGIVQSYRIGSRILYKKEEIETSIKEVRNLKYKRG